MRRGVLGQRALARRIADATQLAVAQLERLGDVPAVAREQDLAARLEEGVEPVPTVAQDGRAAGGRLEQAARRAVAHRGHGARA